MAHESIPANALSVTSYDEFSHFVRQFVAGRLDLLLIWVQTQRLSSAGARVQMNDSLRNFVPI